MNIDLLDPREDKSLALLLGQVFKGHTHWAFLQARAVRNNLRSLGMIWSKFALDTKRSQPEKDFILTAIMNTRVRADNQECRRACACVRKSKRD